MAYTKATDFAVKDSLPSGTAAKIIKGTELDNEFNAIQTDLALKATLASPTFTGTVTLPVGQSITDAALTGNPTAPTATFGDADTSIATTAFVQNAVNALPTSIPSVTGNSGKFLTNNGTTANWATLTVTGQGGQTITGNVTLTSASGAAITVTPATPGLYATLPDATTLSTADNLFAIYNAGDYDYGVKDSTGTQLGWVRARTGAMIGLSDKSTAAGIWAYYGLEKTGITASYVNSTLANMGSTIRRIALDANRTCFLFGGTDCYAIVYDASTQTWGSATLVRATIGSGRFIGVLSATNQVLVVSNSSTTAMEAVTLTISGTTITVNSGTKATATLGGSWTSYGQLIAVGSSFVVSYARATTTTAIRAISVSGTTPTIGAESTISTVTSTDSYQIFASGSIVRTIANTTANTVTTCQPFTVSGSALSPGTSATITVTNGSGRAFLNGNGNIVYHYINTTHYATIFKLTGTTEAASSVSLGTVPNAITTGADYVSITASKTLFVSTDGSTTWKANILTDTAGTASAGTEISNEFVSTSNGVAGIMASGNNARIAVSSSASTLGQATLDCSGTSPVLSSIVGLAIGSGAGGYFRSSDIYGLRSGYTAIAGTSAFAFSTQISAQIADNCYLPTKIRRLNPLMAENASVQGLLAGATNECFIFGNISGGTVGQFIQRIEVAA